MPSYECKASKQGRLVAPSSGRCDRGVAWKPPPITSVSKSKYYVQAVNAILTLHLAILYGFATHDWARSFLVYRERTTRLFRAQPIGTCTLTLLDICCRWRPIKLRRRRSRSIPHSGRLQTLCRAQRGTKFRSTGHCDRGYLVRSLFFRKQGHIPTKNRETIAGKRAIAMRH